MYRNHRNKGIFNGFKINLSTINKQIVHVMIFPVVNSGVKMQRNYREKDDDAWRL